MISSCGRRFCFAFNILWNDSFKSGFLNDMILFIYICVKFNENRHAVILNGAEFIMNVMSNDKD